MRTNPAKLLKPKDAAQILGISYPTLKQWIYHRKLRTVKTAGGHHRIPESELDKYLYKAGLRAPGPNAASDSGKSAAGTSSSAGLQPSRSQG